MRCRNVSLALPTVLALLAALSFPVPPASAAGFDLSWDQCAADGRVSNRAFACDTDDGTHTLVASCRLDAPLASVAVIEAVLDLIIGGSQPVPDWWDFENCRFTSLNADATISPSAANCADWGSGGAFAGVIGYNNTGTIAPGDQASHRRILVAATHDTPFGNIAANQETFLFNVTIDNFMTTDTGSGICAGCELTACLVLNSLRFTTSTLTVTTLTTPSSPGSQFATWQGGAGANCSAVPVRKSTWSGLKALYR